MKKNLVLFVLFFSVFFFSWVAVYRLGFNKLALQSEDTLPTAFLPITIIKEHSLFLDTYFPMMLEKYPNPDDKSHTLGLIPFYVRKVGTHYVSAFPIITALLALPFYLIAIVLKVSFDWNAIILLVHVSSSAIMAATVLTFYLIVDQVFKLTNKQTYLLTFIYGFCSINYALVSQGLWQHGAVQLFTLLSVYFLLKFSQDGLYKFLIWFGFYGGLAVLSRPTAGLIFVILGGYLIFNKDFFKRSFYIGIGLLTPLLFFVWYNAKFYLSISNQGYANQIFRNWLGDFPISFFGVWASPSKGILVYSPVFIFSIVGFIKTLKAKIIFKNEFLLFGLIVFLHTLIISFWKHWFGGWSFGYRMSSDVLPFVGILIIPFIQSNKSKIVWNVFLITIPVSFFVELGGMFFFDGVWHAVYDRGFTNTGWLWSIKDSEFVFNIRRTLVKFGYLARACATCLR